MIHGPVSAFVFAALALVGAASLNVPRSQTFDIAATFTDFTAIYKSLTVKKKAPLPAAPPPISVPDPKGYQSIFGPLAAANNAPFYMGFIELDAYDVQACADACNAADPDSKGGYCQYFNIWQAVINGTAAQTVCAKYYVPTNATTATNTGNGNITVSLSLGYARQSLLPDGTFEGYSCPVPTPQGSYGCYTETYGGWVGKPDAGGYLDAVINYYYVAFEPIIGHSWAQVGGVVTNTFNGTLAPAMSLATTPGATYVLGFHHRSQDAPQPRFPDNIPVVEIIWNGKTIHTISGFFIDLNSTITTYIWQGYTVVAQGNDTIAFHGGVYPNVVNLDNIFLFAA